VVVRTILLPLFVIFFSPVAYLEKPIHHIPHHERRSVQQKEQHRGEGAQVFN